MPSFGESAAKLLLEIDTDASSSKREITELRALIAAETAAINKETYVSTIQQNAATESLQRQRSSNLIRLWNDENNSVVSLQKQRSAALIAENKNLEKTLLNDLKVLKVSGSYTDDLIKQNERAIANFGAVALKTEQGVARTEAKLLSAKNEAAAFGSTLGTVASDLAGPLTLVGGLLAGLAVGAAAVGIAIFKVASDSAEFGDKLFDMSQKVNFSAHELSALKIAAEQSGGSIEGISTALGLFDKNIELAAQGNKKLSGLFKSLSIDTKDNQTALEGAFRALGSMAAGSQQTALAMQLFGRSGKDVLGVIKQVDGDLPAFIQKMDDLGLTISNKDAKAANEFSDALATLKSQLEIVEVQIGSHALPILTKFFEDLSEGLISSKANVMAWGSAFEGATNIAVLAIQGFLNSSEVLGLRTVLGMFGSTPAKTIDGTEGEQYRSTGEGTDPESRRLGKFRTSSRVDIPKTGGGSNKAEAAARKKATEEYRVELKKAADAEREVAVAVATNTRNNKEELDQQTIDIAKFTEDAKKYNQQLYDAETARYDAETKAATVARDKKILSQQQYNEINNDIRIKRLEADERFNAKEEELENDKNTSIAESDENARKRAYDTAVQADARLLAQTRRLEEEKYITHEEAESRRQQIDQVAYERTVTLLNADLLSTTTSAEQKKDIQKAIIDLEGDHKKQVIDNQEATHKARQQDVDDLQEEADAVAELTARESARAEAERLRRAQDSNVGQFLQGLDTGTFDVIRDKSTGASLGISNMTQAMKTLGQVGGAVVNGLAQGIGNLVQNIVLMGTAGPHAMRKLVASVLAGVAAQAAVMAVMELAYGIAALTPWGAVLYGPAPLHFKAAALFGSIALVSGLAGRAIAGDSFKDQGVGGVAASGTAGGIGSTGTTGTGSNQAATITQNRNQPASAQHTVTIKLAAGLVADHLEADVQNNGKSREVILKLVNA